MVQMASLHLRPAYHHRVLYDDVLLLLMLVAMQLLKQVVQWVRTLAVVLGGLVLMAVVGLLRWWTGVFAHKPGTLRVGAIVLVRVAGRAAGGIVCQIVALVVVLVAVRPMIVMHALLEH